MTNVHVTPPCCGTTIFCSDRFGCAASSTPDFMLKRHDTHPNLSISVADENGPLMLSGLVLEASMWCRAKLKSPISDTDSWIALANNIGFQQILLHDIIVMDQVRSPEQMLVIGFDEVNHLVNVQRGYNSTAPAPWRRGACMRIFRFMSQPGVTEMVYDDVLQPDGCTKNQLMASNLIYEWQPNDTCVPGCFFLEFKLMQMGGGPPTTPVQPGCSIGAGVQWVRRFPVEGEGFVIRIVDSPTVEL